jgi:hypothetical protein
MSPNTSVRSLVCWAAALGLVCFLPLRSFCKETTRSIASLTPDQRNHLPANTQVALPGRGTVTLGMLRAEHGTRMERFSRAGQWGKRVAERMPKATQVPGLSATHGPTQQKQSGPLGGGPLSNADAGPPSKGSGVRKGGSGIAQNSVATAVLTDFVLVQRQTYNIPIPKDYTDFCNAAQASVCIYLPPNATFATEDFTLPGDILVNDVDPLITDPAACRSFGGSLDGMQQCVFKYFFYQQTNFKYPGGKASWAVQCDPGAGHGLNPELGTVWADTGRNPPLTTGAAPLSCVVQLWFNQ